MQHPASFPKALWVFHALKISQLLQKTLVTYLVLFSISQSHILKGDDIHCFFVSYRLCHELTSSMLVSDQWSLDSDAVIIFKPLIDKEMHRQSFTFLPTLSLFFHSVSSVLSRMIQANLLFHVNAV